MLSFGCLYTSNSFTCNATFRASSGIGKPICSRYFDSVIISDSSGAKSTVYLTNPTEPENGKTFSHHIKEG